MQDNFVFFWKEYQNYGFFSNWSKHSVTENGIRFETLEHYLMYHKAILMGDKSIAKTIINEKEPVKVKNLGRKVSNFDPIKWNEHKFNIMCKGIKLKVKQHSDIKKALLETGDKIIAEASPFDNIWGIGTTAELDIKKWKGKNLLGKAWMKVRDSLKCPDKNVEPKNVKDVIMKEEV